MKVYILQNQDAIGCEDEISAFGSLIEAAAAYNETIKETADLYKIKGYKSSLLKKGAVAKAEGRTIDVQWKAEEVGCTHTISLFSREIQFAQRV